jgi:hypothetical protein
MRSQAIYGNHASFPHPEGGTEYPGLIEQAFTFRLKTYVIQFHISTWSTNFFAFLPGLPSFPDLEIFILEFL